MRILVVEDDDDLAEVLVEMLEEERYAVDRVADGAGADEHFAIHDYDLVVLDWSIPEPSGLELLAGWRDAGHHTPVLMLTGRRTVADRVDGLDAGADDYLTKPFAMDELLARVRSLLRRRERRIAALQADDLVLEPSARRVTLAGRTLKLTPKEFGVVEYLLRHIDETVTRTDLCEHVWDDSFDAMSNVVDVLLYRLRKKIDGGRDRRLLHTIKGVGYRLSSEREP